MNTEITNRSITAMAMIMTMTAAAPPPKPTAPASALASVAPVKAKPYAFRGVRLGVSLDEFRQIPIVFEEPRNDPQTTCSGDRVYSWYAAEYDSSENKADGLTTCQWFGQDMKGVMEAVFVGIGAGKTRPLFQFIDDSTGTPRLMRITSYLPTDYYPAILDALRRGYGQPATSQQPFQTMAGATFTATTSFWSNGASTITLTAPCRQLERYCLEYRHDALGARYDAVVEKRRAAAAEKL